MEGEHEEDQNYLSFGNFSDISQALDDGNRNVSTEKSLTLLPLPQRITKIKRSRSNQNQNMNGGTRASSSNLSNKSSTSTIIDEEDIAGKFKNLLTNKNLANTTSAPSVLINDNSKKRNRSNDSSNTSSTSKPVNKKSGNIENAQSNTFRVSFAPQVNQNSDDDDGEIETTTAMTISTSTSNARALNKDSHDMATGPNDKQERIVVNALAKPMWEVTRSHLINQQKTHLRSEHLKGLLTKNIMPIEFFGAEPLHRYYATNDGILSLDMQDLIGRQAREKAELVYKELVAQAEREQRNATYFATITAQIYKHEGDEGFDNANVGLQKVVSFYQKSESARLDALTIKETERQPTTELEWTNIVCQPLNQLPRTDRSNSRGRKRQRNGSSGRRAPKPSAATTTPNVTPSASYTNATANRGNSSNTTGSKPTVSKNYKGNNPNPNHNNRPQQQNGGQRQGPRNQSNQQPQQQQQQRPKQNNNPPRRQESNYSQPCEEARPSTSRQPPRSASTERMMAAITALKLAMKD